MNIKVLIVATIIIIGFQNHVFSNFVPDEKAKILAVNFYFEKINQFLQVEYKNLEVETTLTFHEKNQTLYYVFNFKDYGFIIVSADDDVFPVLGYSFENGFVEEDISPAFNAWMNLYKEQILKVREQNLKATEIISETWSRYLEPDLRMIQKTGMTKGIEPLLHSRWGQGTYYNAMCPPDPNGQGGHAISGCVAIAMSQVLFYFRYPETGEGSKSYYDPDYGTISANFGETTYNWNEMVNAIHQQSNPAIAELVFHAGVSVEMNYGTNSSGAMTQDTPDALKSYFRYADNAQYIIRFDTTVSFVDSLINCLDRELPLIFRGGGLMASHSFVCDGYQDTSFFHFNWGWNGNHNGYYFIDNLNPGGYDFTFNQGAVINIYPREDYPVYCQGTDTLSASRGTFFDGSGAEDYLNNLNCEWLIKPDDPSITNIQFWFAFLDTESDNDLVTVYDGSTTQDPVLGIFSGNDIPPIITSSGNELLVVFTTDNNNVAAGWLAEYMAYSEPFCNSSTTYTYISNNYFSDGSGPYNYTNNSDCKWLIEPYSDEYDSVSAINLYFYSFNLFDEDTLFVFDGDSENAPVIEKLTGDEIPDDILSTGNKMFLWFKTNEQNIADGWEAGYYSILPEYCHDTIFLTESSGVFDDGSGEKNYMNDSECYWLIEPENAIAITLTFIKFDIEHGYDQVKIFDASVMPPVLDTTYWGHEIPQPVTVNGNKMLVRFTTDYSIIFDGWEAEYVAVESFVEENNQAGAFRIFPNPASGEFYISANLKKTGDIIYEMFDISGRKIMSELFKTKPGEFLETVDISELYKGIYFIQLKYDKSLFFEKIVKK